VNPRPDAGGKFSAWKPTLRLVLDRLQVPVRRIKTLHAPPLDLVFADHVVIVGDDSELNRVQFENHGSACLGPENVSAITMPVIKKRNYDFQTGRGLDLDGRGQKPRHGSICKPYR
jgi:hypothetical protein